MHSAGAGVPVHDADDDKGRSEQRSCGAVRGACRVNIPYALITVHLAAPKEPANLDRGLLKNLFKNVSNPNYLRIEPANVCFWRHLADIRRALIMSGCEHSIRPPFGGAASGPATLVKKVRTLPDL